ncbi:MAG: hemerythrin domain-containing protein [Maritimibacter sp.]
MSLTTRTGLPPELRILADAYPREMWQGHANFSQLTAFWLDRHGMFRELTAKLIASSQEQLDGKSDPMRFGANLSRLTGFFLENLHGHHSIEDHHYFPQLAPLDSRVARAFELLDADHHALHEHLSGLAEATNAVLRPLQDGAQITDPTAKLLRSQTALTGFLERHLTDEEDVVIPLILEYGPDLS